MERECLLTAAYIQEMWLWYVVMSSRRRCHGLWNLEAEACCYGGSTEEDTTGAPDIADGDLILDEVDNHKVALSLPNTAKRIEHLESVKKLIKEMKFVEAKYVIHKSHTH